MSPRLTLFPHCTYAMYVHLLHHSKFPKFIFVVSCREAAPVPLNSELHTLAAGFKAGGPAAEMIILLWESPRYLLLYSDRESYNFPIFTKSESSEFNCF